MIEERRKDVRWPLYCWRSQVFDKRGISHLSRERSEFRRLEKQGQNLLHESILVQHSKHTAVG